MNDSAIITVNDHGTTMNIYLERGGDPVSVGRRLLETGKVLPGSKREPGELPALLLTTTVCAASRSDGRKHSSVRLLADHKDRPHVAFSYEVLASTNSVSIKATEHGKNGAKAGNGGAKVLFDGAVLGYVAALSVPGPASWEHRWLVEVISVEQDIYHRVFTATEAQAGKLRSLIDALVKAKELKGGSVVPVAVFETRYTVDNLIGQLTDLLGAGAVKRAAAAIAARPASPKSALASKPKSKQPGSGAKPKHSGGAGKAAK